MPTPDLAAGRFELLATIGEGGMATLHLARFVHDAAPPQAFADAPPIAPRSPEPGALVAVKMVRPQYSSHRAFVTSLADEASLISRIAHPNIVKIYELGVHRSQIFIAMELLFGQTLLELAASCGSRGIRLPLPALAWIVARAAEGLHAAHESREATGDFLELIHRDVPAIRAWAHALPLRDGSADAAMAVLTIHHWDDERECGVRELRRVARGPVVIVTIDAEVAAKMWLADYMPEVAELDRRIMPRIDDIARWLGGSARIEPLPVPRDTPDWTLMSFWAHPERVLDEDARNATSGFARMPKAVVDRVVTDVARDLADGSWDARYGHLRKFDAYDAGLRLVVG